MAEHIRWTDSEWLFFAMELAKIRPEVLRPGRYVANLESLRAAMEKMPPERRRPFPASGGLNSFREKLQQIYDNLRQSLADDPEFIAQASVEPSPPPARKAPPTSSDEDWRHKPRTKWRGEEYVAMARVLLARRPNITIDDLSLVIAREAMEAALGPDRQRTLYSITPLRPHFEDAFARVRAEPKPPAEDARPLNVPPLPQYGPLRDVTPAQPAQPTTTWSDTQQYNPGQYEDEDVPLTYDQLDHTAWEPHEWRLVAEELNRRYPEAQFRHDPELTALTPEKLMVAQRVLPPRRRRQGFFGLTRPKDSLWEQFSKMPGAATITAVPVPTSQPEPEHEEEPQPPAAPQPQPEPPQPAAPARPVFPPATMVHNGVDPLRVALADMAKIFADALAQSLRPVLRELIVELRPAPAAKPLDRPFSSATAGEKETVRAAVTEKRAAPPAPAASPAVAPQPVYRQPPSPPAKPHIEPAPKKPAPPAKPLVGVVGAQPIQERMLEASYPQLKFVFGDKHQKVAPLINSLRDCVRVIAMGQFMTKSHLGGLADHFQHRFAKVMGSGSSVKHQIDLWLHQGILNEHYVADGDDGDA